MKALGEAATLMAVLTFSSKAYLHPNLWIRAMCIIQQVPLLSQLVEGVPGVEESVSVRVGDDLDEDVLVGVEAGGAGARRTEAFEAGGRHRSVGQVLRLNLVNRDQLVVIVLQRRLPGKMIKFRK